MLNSRLGLVLHRRLQQKKNQRVATAIELVLKANGPMTLRALGDTLDMRSFFARGKVR